MKKLRLKKAKNQTPQTEKEKVEQRRAEVLARGRKFKYPIQYAKHHVVLITIIIAFFVSVGIFVFGWATFYKFQDTGEITYRISRFLPLYVADVDDEKVKFSDYLMLFRSSIYVAERQSGKLGSSEDASYVRNAYKIKSLENAEKYAYATKLARELNIDVNDSEIDEAFSSHKNTSVSGQSEEAFLKIVEDNFGYSKEEYRRILKLSILKEKVSQAIDKNAEDLSKKVEKLLKENDNDYYKVQEKLGDKIQLEDTGGLVDNKNIDGGRAIKASTLNEGENSGKFLSSNGDCYYYLKLVSKTNTKVNYVSIRIPFTEFEKRFEDLKSTGKIREYIELDRNTDQ